MMWNEFLQYLGLATPPPQTVRPLSVPISKESVRDLKGFHYSNTWTCACGAQLRIRTREPRGDGPSNYAANVPSGALTWNGLAVERGWLVEPKIVCPACQQGMTVREFKARRRREGLV